MFRHQFRRSPLTFDTVSLYAVYLNIENLQILNDNVSFFHYFSLLILTLLILPFPIILTKLSFFKYKDIPLPINYLIFISHIR